MHIWLPIWVQVVREGSCGRLPDLLAVTAWCGLLTTHHIGVAFACWLVGLGCGCMFDVCVAGQQPWWQL